MVLDTKKSNFGNQQCLRFHIWFTVALFYKIRHTLIENATAILLQNATRVYYKMRQVFYNKIRQLLQMRPFYYKMQCLLQNASVHRAMVSEVDSDALQAEPKPIMNLKKLMNFFQSY